MNLIGLSLSLIHILDVLNGSPIDGIAVVSAIMKSADPEAAARELFGRVRVIKENNR